MSETFAQLRYLIFLVMIFGFMIGIVSKKRVTKLIAGMIFMPALVVIIWQYIQNIRAKMDPIMSLFFIMVILIVGIVLTLRFLLGKEVWRSMLGDFVYDVLKWTVLLPFRIMGGLFNLFFKRR